MTMGLRMRHALALSFALATAAAHSDYYTWDCGDGIPHNGSTVPNDAVECGYQQFSDDGNLVHTELSLHDKEQEKKENEDAEAQRLEAEEQAARDQRWLLIYGTAAEAEAMRDRRIAGVETKISELREQESRLELNLRKAEEDARDFERQGRDVPPTVYDNIRKLEQRSIENDDQIEQRRAEIEGIVAEFQVVIDRLRELVGE